MKIQDGIASTAQRDSFSGRIANVTPRSSQADKERRSADKGARPKAVCTRANPLAPPVSMLRAQGGSLDHAAVAATIAKIAALCGTNAAKMFVARLIASVLLARRRCQHKLPFQLPRLHQVFVGPPGTGKRTVALHYAQLLHALGVTTKPTLVEFFPHELISPAPFADTMVRIAFGRANGGLLLIRDAQKLEGHHDCLRALARCMEAYRGRVVVVCTGETVMLQHLIAGQRGLSAQVGEPVLFEAFSDGEMASMLADMACRNGYALTREMARTVGSELGKLRCTPGFDHARAVERTFQRAVARAAVRLQDKPQLSMQREVRFVQEDFLQNNKLINSSLV